MGGNVSGHVIINEWNVEWHSSDGHIVNIPIDQSTNLPLIHNFVCTSAKEKKFGAQHINNAVVGNGLCKQCNDTPGWLDQYELKKAVLYCMSVE